MTCDEQRLLTNSAPFCARNEANSSSDNRRAETNWICANPTPRHLAKIAMLKCAPRVVRDMPINGSVRITVA
jgi:hypothetical protein